ncbi:FecR protein [Anaerohalosphaera lusitana]|uniref:FecR protein n=1 Tax=Anaerohalosphaera lusitana TaxID=1936003 RepID=A0A1U9NLD0_9BACT|nr:FecR domain-containing protein [Anaerohalosphaera lusitana]AQT68743.1 FecR protein [Anaerohalosphaera lusitana]
MILDPKKQLQITRLILALQDEMISAEEFDLLQNMLEGDSDAIEFAADLFGSAEFLREGGRTPTIEVQGSTGENDPLSLHDSVTSELWLALAEAEKNAEAVPVESNEPVKALNHEHRIASQRAATEKAPVSKALLAISAFSSFALLCILVLVLVDPSKPLVGYVTESVDSVWVGKDFKSGDPVREGTAELRSGFASITLNSGAEVIIEGPAEVEFTGEKEMALLTGKVFASVPPSAIGFTIQTPGANVVDYGTEFGVLIDSAGKTEAHVFKGEVELRPGSDPLVFDNPTRLTEGYAASFDPSSGTTTKVHIKDRVFVRQVDSSSNFVWRGEPIHLADIIGHGSGFGTGKLNNGIDPLTGKLSKDIELWAVYGESEYRNVDESEMIDGVFIANATNGPVQVSSKGHLFREAPVTTGMYWGGVFNGAMHEANDCPRHNLVLDGIEYGRKDGPSSFSLHSNLGVTFDLDSIRNNAAWSEIKSLTAKCGISSTTLEVFNQSATADFFVLVDGQVRYTRKDVTSEQGGENIDIKLSPRDRFLTFIVTDAGSEYCDWALIAEPFLHFED